MEFTDLLQEHGIDFRLGGEHHHVSHDWIGFDCPYCDGQVGSYHAAFNSRTRAMNCWRCGRLNATETLAELTGLGFAECKQLVIQLGGSGRIEESDTRGKLMMPCGVVDMLKAHRLYLRRRGFDPDVIAKLWGVRGIAHSDRLAWRLWLPIHRAGKIVSWTTRAISERVEPKYVSASANEESVPRNRLLYGMDYARHTCIVVEGPTDVWRVGPGAVATLGMSISNEQIAMLTSFPTRAVCYDSEPMAQDRARRLVETLSMWPGRTYRVELDADDPGSASPEEIRKMRQCVFGE